MSNDNENMSKNLEGTINRALSDLEGIDPASSEYEKIVEQITKVHAMLPDKSNWLKPELLLPILGNLAGIVAILNHERAHVVTTKALGFVLKPRW